MNSSFIESFKAIGKPKNVTAKPINGIEANFEII